MVERWPGVKLLVGTSSRGGGGGGGSESSGISCCRVSEGESWMIFWDRTSFVLISGRLGLLFSEPNFDGESAIVNARGVSRPGVVTDGEHCQL